MNQIIQEYTIYESYCLLIVQVENDKGNQQDFEKNFSNFISQFTDQDKIKIVTFLTTQYPWNIFLKNQSQQFQPRIASQSRMKGLPSKEAQKVSFSIKSKFEILQEYASAKQCGDFELLNELMSQGQFFNYMGFPQSLGQYKDIMGKLKGDGLKIWEIIEMSQKPTLQVNINILSNIMYFIFNKPKLNLTDQVRILEFIGETTRCLIVQFQYLVKQQQINDEGNYDNFTEKLQQVKSENHYQETEETQLLDQFTKSSFIYLIIKKIALMNFDNFLDYWFDEIGSMLKIYSNDKITFELKVMNAVYVNFEIQGQQLYFLTLFALWYSIDKNQVFRSVHHQHSRPNRMQSAILVSNNEKTQGLGRANSFTQSTQSPPKKEFIDLFSLSESEFSFLQDKQKYNVEQLSNLIPSSPEELFNQYPEFFTLYSMFKKVSNYHFQKIFGDKLQVKRIIIISQMLPSQIIKRAFNFLHDVFHQQKEDILNYTSLVQNQIEYKIREKQILLSIIFLFYNFDLSILHFYFEQLEQEILCVKGQNLKTFSKMNNFPHGIDISLEEFNLSLTLVDESERSHLINKWLKNIWDPISFKNLIPFFFNILKREENIQEILSEINDQIQNDDITYCDQFNHKMLFQIFFNNANQELQVMLLKLQSRFFPIPLLFKKNWAQDEDDENLILNANVFYVFQESYTIINFSLNQINNQIGKTELINTIFYQVDKFEIRDTCKFNSQTIDIMFDYSFNGTRNLTIADCHHFISLKILDKLLPLFKLWIIQVDGEKEIDEMLGQLQKLHSFENVKQKQIIVLIRNSVKSQDAQNKLRKLENQKIEYIQVKDLTNKTISKQNQESEISNVSKKLFSIIGTNYQQQLVNQECFFQIIKTFNESQSLDKEIQQNIKIINKFEFELNNLVHQEEAFNSPDAFPVRYLENSIKSFKDDYKKLSTQYQQENTEERLKIDEKIRSYEKSLTTQKSTIILDLFCLMFQQQNYYILYLWFVDVIRSLNKHHTYKLMEENQKIMEQIALDKKLLKQLKQDTSQKPKIESLSQSIKKKTVLLENNQIVLKKRYISIELFWREIIFLSKHRPLPYNMNPSQIVHEMVSKGEPFEFLDGDQLKIDQQFLQELIKNLKNQGKEQILVFSILGPQSSGKSTILNKIFGCHFLTSAGRCTKGIYLQLLKIHNKKLFNDQFDYILILDSEGLQSPSQADQEFDKKIALFILAISDIILITVKGEITAHFRNLVQMCVFSLGQLKSISSLKQISWCFNQNHNADEKQSFFENINDIAESLNIEFNKQQQQQDSDETQDYNEILGIQLENIKILGFAQSEVKWNKSKSGIFCDCRQYNLQEAFSQEAYDFGVKIIDAYSKKFQQQGPKELMKDLNSFIINLCKQWDSIQRLPDLLEFSELVQHQQNQKMKQQFEQIIQKQNISRIPEMLDDIKEKLSEKNKVITINYYNDLQEQKDQDAENTFYQIQSEMNSELEKFKNENNIQKKIFKKYENMIENRIKSALQECQLAIRNEIQNHKIEFQKQKGFYLLDKYVEDLRYKQKELQKLKNNHDEIKNQFDEIWQKIMVQQTKIINDIFEEYARQILQIITNEFSNCYLRSKNEKDFQDFFIKQLVKQSPTEMDFYKIFDKFSIELQPNQFVPIERSHKNRILIELFHRDFDLKIQSQKSSDYLQLSQFYLIKINVYYVQQSEIEDYLKTNLLQDLKYYLQKARQDNFNTPLSKLTGKFLSLLFCFGVQFEQHDLDQFTKILENQYSFIQSSKFDEKKEKEIQIKFEKLFKIQTSSSVIQESEISFNRIKEYYLNLKIRNQEVETDLQSYNNILKVANNSIGYNQIIVHIKKEFVCRDQDKLYKQTFQYIQNQKQYQHYQNEFKGCISQIAQEKMQENKNQKWKQIYQCINDIVLEEIIPRESDFQPQKEFYIPQYNVSKIRIIMQQIERFIDDSNKQFSNFGIILNDIGQRCIYYFSLLIIWRLLCYGQWQIKSLHLMKLHDETDVQYNKFKADILQNQLEQSILRGTALANEIYNNFLQKFYLLNSHQAQNYLKKYQNETSNSLIKSLDYQILEKGDQNISDEQIMEYIRDQSGYIKKVVMGKIQQFTQEIKAFFQQSLQQTVKKLLLDVQHNSKNLKDLSVDSMKAKNYFKKQNIQHEKILFQIVIQCLQGKTQILELEMIKEENQDAFSLINPTEINSPLIEPLKFTTDSEIQILRDFMIAFTDKIAEFISNCHKLQLDLRELNVENDVCILVPYVGENVTKIKERENISMLVQMGISQEA